MKDKYSSLKTIAWFIKFFANISLFITVIQVIGLFLIANTNQDAFNREFSELGNFYFIIQSALNLSAVAIIITGIFIYIVTSSIAERIRLLIDLEFNSRNIDNSLKKIVTLLETKFEMASIEPEEERSLIQIIKNKIDEL
jgi:hypothetical protein